MEINSIWIILIAIAWAARKWYRMYREIVINAYFKDKVIWITGASSGLGRSFAIECYKLGAKLILSARRKEELEKTMKMCIEDNKTGNKEVYEPYILPLDLDKPEELKTKTKTIEKEFGQVDIIIHAAGQGTRTAFMDSNLDVHKLVMNTNYFGPLMLTREVLPLMMKRHSGSIVFISSVQGLMGINDRSPYSASKHALIGLSDTLNIECSFYDIHVMDVCPGYIKTDHSRNALTGSGGKYGENDKTYENAYEPKEVVEKIMVGIFDKKNELIIADFKTKAALFLRYMLPDLYFKIMIKRARKQHSL